jgi:hypothetical protein
MPRPGVVDGVTLAVIAYAAPGLLRGADPVSTIPASAIAKRKSVPGSGAAADLTVGAGMSIPGGCDASLAKVAIVSGEVMSICTKTSKKSVGIPNPELSRMATVKASGDTVAPVSSFLHP